MRTLSVDIELKNEYSRPVDSGKINIKVNHHVNTVDKNYNHSNNNTRHGCQNSFLLCIWGILKNDNVYVMPILCTSGYTP